MLMVGFQGTEAPDSLRALLDEPLCTGVIWFARNIQSLEQVARVNEALLAQRPDLLIAVDQEGGPVRRFREGFPDVPAMREVTSDEQARELGRLLAEHLAPMGFNLNLAPVLDVDSNPDNPIIGARAFSRDPQVVAQRALALHQGLLEGGVLGCGKHFPGHGDTAVDSHLALPVLHHSLERLRALELIPFKAAVDADFAAIMTAHILFPALDPDVPATMSRAIIQGLLRQELGFEGLVLSDDLEMKAVAAQHPIETVVARGAEATVDLFLVCAELEQQRRALAALKALPEERRALSMARVGGVLARLGVSP
jgi:beta-N-acetylhexosaminidase